MKYKLRNFVEAVSETEPSPQNSQFDRFVGLEHYDSGEIEITRYTDTSLLSSSVKIFRANDILIARRNVYLKRAGIVFFDGLTSGDSIILRVLKDCERGTGVPYSDALRWLPLILNSSAFWAYANKHADGMNSKRISKEMLLDYEFSAPSIETIRSIADKVWSAHSLKKRYRKLLDLTDEMVKSRFIEDFYDKGYPSLSLNSFAKIVTGSTPSRSINEYWFNGSHPWVSAQDMGEKFVDSTAEFITDSGMATCKLIPAGSLLYVCRGSIGVMSINRIDCATNQSICSAIPDSSICKTEYLYYWLLYHEGEITSLGEGTSFKSLSQKTFASLEIQLPPIKKQLHFITLTQQADKSKLLN